MTWACVLVLAAWLFLGRGLPANAGWLILLLCPLMHVVMMMGGRGCHLHGNQHQSRGGEQREGVADETH
ncbi:MAG: DUF2933 domain-containing protein [Bacillota bacterium]